ncbi:MAG TPA: hypothetical protein VMI54_24570 [Polyangiaceae bacterium]|nr:hypothetical protein [Polyangiaceae bacterium]
MGKKNHTPKPKAATRSTMPPASSRASQRPPAPIATMPVPAPPQPSGRRLGVRGAAPWAARHAERRALEAAARLRDPPRPGSARATLRTPDQADRIKARIGELHTALGRVRALKKNLQDGFWELAHVLKHVADERLFDAKGYATFEAFIEREVDLGSKSVALKLSRLPEVFLESAARRHGLDAVLAALDALDSAKPVQKKAAARQALPLKPLKPPK